MEFQEKELNYYRKGIIDYVLPQCTEDDLHDLLNQVCIDFRCPKEKQLRAICSGCTEVKSHSANPTHQQRQLKRVLLEIAQDSVQQNAYCKKSLANLNDKLLESFESFQKLGYTCLEIANQIKGRIQELKDFSEQEYITKKDVLDNLVTLFQTPGEKELQVQLEKIRVNLKIEKEKISIDNDSFDQEWKLTEKKTENQIEQCKYLLNLLNSTGVNEFVLSEMKEKKIRPSQIPEEKQIYKVVKRDQIYENSITNYIQDDIKDSITKENQKEQPENLKEQQKEHVKEEKNLFIEPPKQITNFSQIKNFSEVQDSDERVFSTHHKGESIQVINKIIAKQMENSKNKILSRVVCIEQPINIKEKSFYGFQVINLQGWVGLGLAKLSDLQKNGFSFNENLHEGNGQYLISNNGQKWYPKSPNLNGQNTELVFQKYDVVLLECDPNKKRLRFKKKDKDGASVLVSLELDEYFNTKDQWHICINMDTKDDSIAIFVDNQKK